MKPNREKRPVLKLRLSRTDYLLETFNIILLLIIWIIPAISFQNMPEIIPTHYGIDGQADGWGSRSTIFILPFISLLLSIGLSTLNRFPHLFNYTVKVTEENALYLYTKGARLFRIVKLIHAMVFLFIEWQVCNVSENNQLPAWFLPVVIIIPVVLPVIMALTLSKGSAAIKKK